MWYSLASMEYQPTAPSHELDELASTASHDLKAPIRTISNLSQLLALKYEDVLDTEARDMLETISRNAQYLAHMIDSLVEYGHVSWQEVNTEGGTDSIEVLKSVLQELQPEIETASAEVTYGSLPPVRCKQQHLQLLFSHLISNALKFSKVKPVRIHISSFQKDHECVFSITDNGVGISPEHQSKIFKLFQRVPDPKRQAGYGIGLAICSRIVERYQGRIWVESASDVGSKFSFTLPGMA